LLGFETFKYLHIVKYTIISEINNVTLTLTIYSVNQ